MKYVSTLKIIMKYILIVLLSLNFFTLFAQRENEFQDYLNHYKEMQLPFDICIDSAKVFFYRPNTIIPLDYVRKYIYQSNTLDNSNSKKYEYYYGIRINLGKFIAVITCKYCDECGSKYGLGIGFYLMTIYALDGTIISQQIIAQGSDQHFYFGTFTKNNSLHSLLSLFIKRGTTFEYLDEKNSIFQGTLDYYTYTVNISGIINENKMKINNVRISWNTEGIKVLEEW